MGHKESDCPGPPPQPEPLLLFFDDNECTDQAPEVWVEDSLLGLVINHAPLENELCAIATPIAVDQYPLSQEALLGTQPYIFC